MNLCSSPHCSLTVLDMSSVICVKVQQLIGEIWRISSSWAYFTGEIFLGHPVQYNSQHYGLILLRHPVHYYTPVSWTYLIGTPCILLHTSILNIFYSDTLYVATHQYPAPLQHVRPVEDRLLVIIMLETDHQRRPATHLRPEQIYILIFYNFLNNLLYLVKESQLLWMNKSLTMDLQFIFDQQNRQNFFMINEWTIC